MDAVRNRPGAEDKMPDGEIYLFLDGGRTIMDRITSYSIGNAYVSKTMHIHLENR